MRQERAAGISPRMEYTAVSDARLIETLRRLRLARNALARHWAVIRKLERDGTPTGPDRSVLARVEETYRQLQAERACLEAEAAASDGWTPARRPDD